MSTRIEFKKALLSAGILLAVLAVLFVAMQNTARAADDEDIIFTQQADEGAAEVIQPDGQQENHNLITPEVPAVDMQPEATQSIVVRDAEIKATPSNESLTLGHLRAGEDVLVGGGGLFEGWTTILVNGDAKYVDAKAIALTAGGYAYEYGANMTDITAYSAGQFEIALAGTGLAGLGETYSRMEREWGINGLFLISIAMLESASGESSLARNKNNLGGLKNGQGGYMSFDTKEACVEYMADLLKTQYLSDSGKYYKGKTAKDVSVRYCEQSASWVSQVESLMNKNFQLITA